MGAFGGLSPKRHFVLANRACWIRAIEGRGGYLPREEQQKLSTKPLTIRGKNGSYTGVKKNLKDSQSLGQLSVGACVCVCQLFAIFFLCFNCFVLLIRSTIQN